MLALPSSDELLESVDGDVGHVAGDLVERLHVGTTYEDFEGQKRDVLGRHRQVRPPEDAAFKERHRPSIEGLAVEDVDWDP